LLAEETEEGGEDSDELLELGLVDGVCTPVRFLLHVWQSAAERLAWPGWPDRLRLFGNREIRSRYPIKIKSYSTVGRMHLTIFLSTSTQTIVLLVIFKNKVGPAYIFESNVEI